MQYYHNIVTEKSWEELHKLTALSEFILIGGWATYLYTKALKSKDIDILITYDKLQTLSQNYAMFKNERLKKYEAVKGVVQIDIYLPHFSEIGIPVEVLLQQPNSIEGFTLLQPDYLLTLKIYTLGQRGRTAKGQKDFLDIISLVQSGICNLQKVKNLLAEYRMNFGLSMFTNLLKETSEIPELDINTHQLSKTRKSLLLDLI
ncbi:MAG: hypothetical protein ACD_22C00282G0002 [uncultured bacterium]|nr:MAG: hypothetical protein ACD_22C00282G0002 [uncultured bacterium]